MNAQNNAAGGIQKVSGTTQQRAPAEPAAHDILNDPKAGNETQILMDEPDSAARPPQLTRRQSGEVVTTDFDVSHGGSNHPIENAEQSGLSGTARTNQGNGFAVVDAQRDRFERFGGRIDYRNISNPKAAGKLIHSANHTESLGHRPDAIELFVAGGNEPFPR